MHFLYGNNLPKDLKRKRSVASVAAKPWFRLLSWISYFFLVALSTNWSMRGSSFKQIKLSKLMVGHLFQNYDTIIRAVFSHVYLQSCLLHDIRAFFVTYTCVLFPSIWPFSYKRAYICAQKNPYICVTNKHVVYAVAESRHVRGTELYRQQKPPSCAMELKSNFSLNQAWLEQGWVLVIALTVVVVVGSPTTDLLESVDCLLRNCVRYFTNADRNNDRFS